MRVRWQDIRFDDETRLELRDKQIVRPLSLGFRFRPSGDEGPAGVFVICATGRTIPSTDPDVEMRGAEELREVYLGDVAEIRRAMTAAQKILRVDTVIDVEADIRAELAGGKIR